MRDEVNPYAPPTAQAFPQASGDQSVAPLFTPKQVGIASFLASVMAGAALIAVNESRLGRGQRGVWVLLGAAGFLVLLIGTTFVAPDLPGFPLGAAGAVAAYYTAKSMFGEEVEEQARRGIAPAKGSAALGWGLLGLLGAVAVMVGAAIAFELAGGL